MTRYTLLALVAAALTACARAEPPVAGIACSGLLPAVFAHCVQPVAGEKEPCCRALKAWNDAGCWCEPAAYSAIDAAPMNGYGFNGRVGACEITPVLRPQQPIRDGGAKPSTCPADFVSVGPGVAGESDELSKACADPAGLRAKREGVIERLNTITLKSSSAADVEAFKGELSALLWENMSFMDIGRLSLFGIEDVTDYFMSRQSALGSQVPWANEKVVMEDPFWREPSIVNYALQLESSEGRLSTRYMFLGFAPCSEKVRSLYPVEAGYINELNAQFYYSRGPADILSQYEISPSDLCKRIQKNCGSSSPYESLGACEKFMTSLKKDKKVLCNKYKQSYVPQLALHGNSIGCRVTYSHVAAIDPEKYCPLLGENSTGRCAEGQCPGGLYADMFTEPAGPRSITGGFACGDGECIEDWPL